MRTKIEISALFGQTIWTVFYLSPITHTWVISGVFEAASAARDDAASWHLQ